MARKKKTKRVPKGSHRMPDGTIMKDKAMKRKRGRKVKKAPALNRQEPWFLGRDYSSTSFTQLHQVNKYNHAVEGLEVLRGYTGRQNELDRRINEQKGSQDDLYKRVAQAERLTQRVARDYRADLAKEQRRGQKFQRDFKKEVEQEQQQQWQNTVDLTRGFDPQAFKKMSEHLGEIPRQTAGIFRNMNLVLHKHGDAIKRLIGDDEASSIASAATAGFSPEETLARAAGNLGERSVSFAESPSQILQMARTGVGLNRTGVGGGGPFERLNREARQDLNTPERWPRTRGGDNTAVGLFLKSGILEMGYV